MIGAKSFDIGAAEFVKGMSTTSFINDGGFSPQTTGVNPAITPGLLYSPANPVNKSTNLVGTIIASSEDPTISSSAYLRIFVDDSGHYYTWDGTTLVNLRTDATNPTGYIQGVTDMIAFGSSSTEGEIYTTNLFDIVRWKIDSTFTANFGGGFTHTNVPHPALVFENNAFYGDGNLLLRQTAVGVAPSVIMTLTSQQTIIALGIDPGSGRMLISTIDGVNTTGIRNRISRVLYYDGFSNKPVKSVIADAMVTAFYPVGGTLYITYGTNLGYWNGAGMSFIRTLNINISSNGNQKLAYKQHITNIETTLYVLEAGQILAYGNILPKQAPVPYYFASPSNGTAMSMICNLGSGVLGFSYLASVSDYRFNTLDTTSTSTVGAVDPISSDKYIFKRPVIFNGAIIEYGTALPTDDTAVGALRMRGSDQQSTLIKTVSTTVSNTYEVESDYPTISTRSIQILYSFIQQYPIRRITVFYSPIEDEA